MMPLLAILIPTLNEREQLFNRLLEQLNNQRAGKECIIIPNFDDREKSTGVKRNECLDKAREANASHVAFFDDDDLPGPNYIDLQMEVVHGNYDCGSLWGQYWENGKMSNPFHHSIIYDKWFQDSKYFYRNPNHLNCIKLELLNDIRFQDKTIGEDGHYSIDLHKAGLLKNEFQINEIIYYYFAGGKKNHSLEPLMAAQRGTKL